MKKILSLILAGLMTLSCAAFVAADDAAVDAAVEQTNTAEDYAIEFLANYGIFKGTSAAELVADAASPIQRYQMALFVSRISTGWVDDAQWEDGPANNSTFEDIGEEPANKYLGALSYANQNGIIEGYSPRTFAPYDGITYRDALTMVVRTLGYKGLAYPWGYIEKAVELGLTADVNVAYTDNLTRGQVAVIIYNAMFANTKSGETLAKKIFDCDFGWENIVIVASNEAAFMNNGKYASNGYVAFKLLNDKGGLSEKTYYVKKAELGLNGDHDDELQVGAAYVALFTVKDDIATMVDADSLNYKTVYNLGITDNAGETLATMPLAAELANYNVVKEYQKPEIISAPDKHEMIVYGTGVTQVTDTNGKRIAIDWNTQNILKWVDATKDVPAHWETAWIYNPTLERYYEYDVDSYGKLYINWMSDKEFEEFYAKAITYVKDTLAEYVNRENANGMNDSAYSKLRMFDTNGDGLAERALFKVYDIGQIYVSEAECGVNANNVDHRNKKLPTYKITTLDGEKVYEQFVEKDHTAHEGLEKGTNLNNKASDHFAWLNVADFVTTFYKEDGSFENGSIVLYNVNKTTGEIEIIKHITAKGSASDDADSYIATGILKGYSTGNANVTIDGEKLPLGYGALRGTIYGNVNHCLTCRTQAAESLDTMLLQYVTYVVVDGRVVDIDLKGQTSDVIVVLGYAGVTSDGYIAVYGYSTVDTTAKIFRIASYNGWKKGDYRYYPSNAWADEAFVAGTIYNITSYDDATQTYNVYTENTDKNAKHNTVYGTFEFDTGYRIISNAEKGKRGIIEKMSKDDRYIIVYDDGTIFVRTGIVTDNNWKIHGKYTKVDSGAYVIYVEPRLAPPTGDNTHSTIDDVEPCYCNGNMKEHKGDYVIGFKETAHEIGFVLYDKKTGAALDAHYDDAIGGDWYLLGSTQTEVRATDLLTGNVETCFVSNNIDLVKGRIYITLNFGGNRMIINQWDDENVEHENHDHNTCAFIERVKQIYCEQQVQDARFMVADPLFFTKANPITKLELSKKLGLIPYWSSPEVQQKYADDMVGSFTYFIFDKNHCVELTKIDALEDNRWYVGAAIYDVSTKNVVVYIYSEATLEGVTTDASGKNNAIKFWYDSDKKTVESELNTSWAGKYYSIRNLVNKYGPDGEYVREGVTTINEVLVNFDSIGETHADIAKNGYLFGFYDMHGINNFSYGDTKVTIDKYVPAENNEYKMTSEEIVLAKETNLWEWTTLPFDKCSIVTGFKLKDLGLKLAANEKADVTFYLYGAKFESETTDLVYVPNEITVTVHFEADKEGVVTSKVTFLKINGTDYTAQIGETIQNWNAGSTILRGVDVANLEEIGVAYLNH